MRVGVGPRAVRAVAAPGVASPTRRRARAGRQCGRETWPSQLRDAPLSVEFHRLINLFAELQFVSTIELSLWLFNVEFYRFKLSDGPPNQCRRIFLRNQFLIHREN